MVGGLLGERLLVAVTGGGSGAFSKVWSILVTMFCAKSTASLASSPISMALEAKFLRRDAFFWTGAGLSGLAGGEEGLSVRSRPSCLWKLWGRLSLGHREG